VASGSQALQATVSAIAGRANQTPGLLQVFSQFETATPQLYLDIDRTKAQMLGINMPDIFNSLQVYLGQSYVNDFNLFGRNLPGPGRGRQPVPAAAEGRAEPARAQLQRRDRAARLVHDRARHRRALSGAALQHLSGRRARWGRRARLLARGRRSRPWRVSPRSFCPTDLASNGRSSPISRSRPATPSIFAFALGVVFVFLVLAAQYESLTLPLAVILIVPMCLVASVTGLLLRGLDNNILTQVGFIVLIGLAAKNAILIVEFAKQLEDRGRDRRAAAVESARLRLRPDPDDLVCLHLRRHAAGVGDRRRLRIAPGARDHRVLRHDRRDPVRAYLHARLLCDRPLDRPTGKPAPAATERDGAGGIGAA